MIGRRLEGPEIAGYDHIDAALAARVRILRVPFLAPGSAGMTIGRFVFLRADGDRHGDRELLAHELVHVRQFSERGLLGFLVPYLRNYLSALRRLRNHRAAYLAIPDEVEARAEAAAWRRRRSNAPW
ncbi:MAG: DUF4157 domain-containing protein [Acidimicrobiales bacterium]